MPFYIGLMSGTSVDGVDGVLAAIDDEDGVCGHIAAHAHRPIPVALRSEWLALNISGADELHRMALAGNALARLYAQVVTDLLSDSGMAAQAVCALGAHGQTVRHRPREFDATGYTIQLLNGALLAELGAIDVVCDLRSRDVAAGGQGAPLVPAFHAARFGQRGLDTAILNLGGIANLTLLAADGRVEGFDCGPASVLMDHWVHRHLGLTFDDGGRWASSGVVCRPLLESMASERYFALPMPKSTGRDLFNPAWLSSHLAAVAPQPSAPDVQATLLELTAASVCDALRRHAPSTQELLVCGGGAFNDALMARLRALASPMVVRSTAEVGVAPDQVEALAFAWLAHLFMKKRPGNLPAVTGARGPRVLGALYPA